MEHPPKFLPGDMVSIVGIEYPPGSGHIKGWMGLFCAVGYPRAKETAQDALKELNSSMVSSVRNGDRCLIVAVQRCPVDKKWYYLLRSLGNSKGFGWSRSAIRMKVDEHQ